MKRSLVAALAALTASPALAQEPALQVDWIQSPINGHWYGVDYTPRSWTDSEALAVSLGGHLATIRSQAEQDWIEQEFGTYNLDPVGLWIGLSDQASEGNFAWSSGDAATYRNWNTPEPNGGLGENYVNMWGPGYSGSDAWRWNDYPDNAYSPGSWDAPPRPLIELSTEPTTGWSWPQTVITGEAPIYGCLADLDGDGDLDYASPNQGFNASYTDRVSIHWNDGTGRFSSAAATSVAGQPISTAAVDVDRDGHLDVVYACGSGSSLGWLRNSGAGAFTLEPELYDGDLHGLCVADLNGDQLDDLLVTSWTSTPAVYYHEALPQGGFAPPSVLSSRPTQAVSCGMFVTAGDLNQDGAADLVVSWDRFDLISVHLNEGNGLFHQVDLMTGARPFRPSLADLDLDGDLDIAIPALGANKLEVWHNDGAGGFQKFADYPAGDGPHYSTTADVNGDGSPDVVVPSYISSDARIFYGDGSGGLVVGDRFTNLPYALFCAADDLDGDDSPDLLVAARNTEAFTVWKNRNLLDCNQNGLPDLDDIANGTSPDCNANGIPDECDVLQPSLDCDANGLLDSCELAAGTAIDCDLNGLIDSCEFAAGTAVDCNLNNTIDACDIAANPLLDCDGNGVIDSCGDPFPDCNGNGVRDTCEVLGGTASDCDGDGVLDSCQIAGAPALDCDGNGLLDSCEIAADPGLDADGSGVLDFCECSQFDSYCQANPNSFSSGGARMGSSGLASVSGNAFQLTVSQAPPGRPGIFFYAANQANAPFGDGTRCVASPIYRLQPPGLINGSGSFSRHLDLTTGPPSAGGGAITVGSTWNFQFWYRDPQGGPNGFNLSDGLEVVFCP